MEFDIQRVFINKKKMVLKLTGYTELMQNEPANKASVDVREKIILPLVTIQQYALQHINFLRKIILMNQIKLLSSKKL